MKLVIFLVIFFTTNSFAENGHDNCLIHIQVFMKNGKLKKELRKYKFEKEEKCKKLSEIYSENFSPDKVKKVETSYRWLK